LPIALIALKISLLFAAVADHGLIETLLTSLVVISTALLVIDSLLFVVIAEDVSPKIEQLAMMAIIIVGIALIGFFPLAMNVVKSFIVTIYAWTLMRIGCAMTVLT